MLFSRAFRVFRCLLLGGTIVLAACSTTGNRFNTADLRFFVPGETTLAEAVQLLQGEPVNIYRQLDGSATARWAHTATLATDAVYFNQELWLAFDSYGRFVRIVKSNNLPHANLYEDGRRIDLPVPQGATPVASPPVPVSAQALPASATPASASTQAGAPPVIRVEPAPDSPFASSAVSYPLGQ